MSETTCEKTDRLVELFLIIDPAQFHFLKFILEGYDNLAVLSAIKIEAGVVRLKTSRESYPDVMNLLTELSVCLKRHIL